jgi:3-phenylpropionate/trans-cinnamate dioxygenase ferredoxin subunit
VKRRVLLGPDQLQEGEMRGYEPEGTARLVCLARVGGRLLAIDDWCNHAGCQLSMGGWLSRSPEGRPIAVCPCHEVGFDLESGRNVTSPGICDDQPAFQVQVEDGLVFAELPDEDDA